MQVISKASFQYAVETPFKILFKTLKVNTTGFQVYMPTITLMLNVNLNIYSHFTLHE